MSHFAKVVDGKVVNVIVAEPEFFNHFVDSSPGQWIQTSYNTRGNKHYDQNNQEDDIPPLRGNFAGIGYTYDITHDVFYSPQPYASWTLNESNWTWEPPVAMPKDGKTYQWNESEQSWNEIILG